MSLEVRDARPNDLDVICEVHRLAFNSHAEAKLARLLHQNHKANPSVVAIVDKKIVASAIFSLGSLEPNPAKLKILGLGPVAVLPEFQRQGIGSMLGRRGIESCKNIDAIVVLGDPKFYSRFGFESARRVGMKNDYVDDDHFMILRQTSRASFAGAFHYAEEFKSLDEVE